MSSLDYIAKIKDIYKENTTMKIVKDYYFSAPDDEKALVFANQWVDELRKVYPDNNVHLDSLYELRKIVVPKNGKPVLVASELESKVN